MNEYIQFVSPNGEDDSPGTAERPLRSLDAALRRTRASSAACKRIIVREGSYYDVGLELHAEDAGLSIEAYPGERPVLYGGVPVPAASWERDGRFLSAPLAGLTARARDIRAVEVNGAFRPRARLPETGAFRHLNEFRVEWVSTYAGGWKREPTAEELNVLHYRPEDIGPELEADNAEVTLYHEWDESLVPLLGVDAEAGTMRFAAPPGHPPGAFLDRNENAGTYVVWNVREGMTRPGQWHIDRPRERLVYWPLPGETPETLRAVVPTRTHIVRLAPGAGGLLFKGLTLACAAAPLAAGGFGAVEAEAAVFGEDVSDVVLEEVTVRQVGGWAIRMSGSSIRLTDCRLHHTGAGGLHGKGEQIALERSAIHDCGLVYSSGVAVMCEGRGHRIRRNEIYRIPYCGIVSVSPESEFSGNLLYDTMTFMKDGAAIYIAHDSKHTVVSGNAVFASPDSNDRVRRYAYYLDEKCEACSVENNLAVNLRVPALSHMTNRCRFVNNFFLDDGEQIVSVLNSFGLVFERNVLAARKVELMSPQGNPQRLPSEEYDSHEYMKRYSSADGIVSLRNNLIHAAGGDGTFTETLHYKPIRSYPIETTGDNAFGDPLFRNPAEGDFSFADGSPAPGRGIRPLSFADTGFAGRFSDLYGRFKGRFKGEIPIPRNAQP